MSDVPVTNAESNPVKRALIEIRELRARLARVEEARREPIAIVGMGMRLPGGVHDARSFEKLLWSATDAITEIPRERWSLDALYAADPDAPGKMITRYGAFIEDVDRFDAEFFNISPREAQSMDPQQRIMLQVAWEALEDAGHAGAGLAGSRTGVYLGVANNDYGRALYGFPELIDPYFSTGNAYSVVAGRLSYFLGLRGPSVAIDTACSSSLVAIHLACQALRLRECDAALAGGVNLILTPEMNINFSKARMMAPDGRCKTFDASADGYVRGEGCAMIMLRRLSDALADGDRILAVIRGSALNQDGRSNGLTAPNGPSQEAVIREALAAAQLPATSIGYIEAHGTGTPLGDPIEVGAIGAALCEERDPGSPLLIGSVKTNFGHLEAAAGVAGLIKVVLSLQRAEIPAHLHFKSGNPHIDWESLPIRVPTAAAAWSPIGGRRVAGVSSFGFSGTNAHVIVEGAPDTAPVAAAAAAPGTTRGTDPGAAASPMPGTAARPTLGPVDRPAHLLTLSARDAQGAAELARAYANQLSEKDEPLSDVCYTANTGRSHFAHRICVVGTNRHEMARELSAYADGAGGTPQQAATQATTAGSLAAGNTEGAARVQVAFLFTGQGAQHAGMARGLYDSSPSFRAQLDHTSELAAPHLDRKLLDVMFAPEGDSTINSARYAQPVNFALQVALAKLWRSWGIEPVAVMGHSLGEYAAACVAGAISLEDGLRAVAARGRLTDELALEGAMGAVFAGEDVVRDALAKAGGALTIAAYNGPEHFVISGPRRAVEQTLASLESRGTRIKLLRVQHGAHSQQIDPVLPAFRGVLETVSFGDPDIALFSNVSGALAGGGDIGHVDYWLTHMRQPVRFAQSMQALAARGITHYIEIGPHPVLLGMGAECITAPDESWLPSLHRERRDWTDLLAGLQRLYVSGADVDWKGFDRDYPRRRRGLPTYPFRKRRHWMDVVGASRGAVSGSPWKAVASAVARQADQGPLDLNAASYPGKWECLSRVTTAHAVRTLREAGLFKINGEAHSLEHVLAKAGIAETYRHLVRRWLDRLVGLHVLRTDGSRYIAEKALPDPQLAQLWEEADRLFTDNRALLAYVRHCGELVGAVLRGQESPLETLFPGGSAQLAEDLYERSATMRYVNGIAAAAFSAAAAGVSPGRSLRVLEVGAGTGGTSKAVLPVLPADRTRYVFSDVSDLFLDRARERFAAYPFMEYRLFDMERDLQAQGLAAGSFDAIVSANAVHASTDLRLALRRLRELLAPGGLLVLVESTTHFDWFDMTTGLIEGWQHFADDLRTDNPLLPPQTWTAALRDAGFEEAMALPGENSVAAHLGQHVIVARVAGDLEGGSSSGQLSSSGEVAATGRPNAAEAACVDEAAALRKSVMEALPADRIELLRDFVRERVVRVLKLDTTHPPGRSERLMDLGLDSLMAVQLRNQLAKGLGLDRPVTATVMFDYPTIEELARHLLDRVTQQAGAAAAGAAAPVNAAGPHAPTGATTAPTLGAEAVAAMSDEQIEALLLERLGKP